MVPNPAARRLLPPSLLALILLIGTVAGAVARDGMPAVAAAPSIAAAAPTGAVLGTESRTADPAIAAAPTTDAVVRLPDDGDALAVPDASRDLVAPRHSSRGGVLAPADGAGPTTDYAGRNHVWMPAIGIDRSVAGYACSTTSYPGNRVYRWGCAGSNNVYLFGHAHSVFKPLHDAYVRGSLKKGQSLFYADGGGTVHRYVVAWWKVTTPTKGRWAYAAQSVPSLTLQTCLGAQSQYRLIVRLTRVD